MFFAVLGISRAAVVPYCPWYCVLMWISRLLSLRLLSVWVLIYEYIFVGKMLLDAFPLLVSVSFLAFWPEWPVVLVISKYSSLKVCLCRGFGALLTLWSVGCFLCFLGSRVLGTGVVTEVQNTCVFSGVVGTRVLNTSVPYGRAGPLNLVPVWPLGEQGSSPGLYVRIWSPGNGMALWTAERGLWGSGQCLTCGY